MESHKGGGGGGGGEGLLINPIPNLIVLPKSQSKYLFFISGIRSPSDPNPIFSVPI